MISSKAFLGVFCPVICIASIGRSQLSPCKNFTAKVKDLSTIFPLISEFIKFPIRTNIPPIVIGITIRSSTQDSLNSGNFLINKIIEIIIPTAAPWLASPEKPTNLNSGENLKGKIISSKLSLK